MGFEEIEAAGKAALERYPQAKRAAKRVYQLASVATSLDRFLSEGGVSRVTPDDGWEYFYGYYDKSPWDATERYMIVNRVHDTSRHVAPSEPGTVCLVDTENGNAIIELGETRSWNVQQGCMAQWLGPDFASRIVYNDFRDGAYCSVVFDVSSMSEERVLPMPVYDVARDGTYALSLDFSRLHRMRPGYGYSNLLDETEGELCPSRCCIWKMDMASGEVTELLRYMDLALFETDESMAGAEHKVNHLMISPSGSRFMVLHRWFQRGRKHTRLVTADADGTNLYNLSDDVFVSHCYWKDDEHILSFLRKEATGNHYYLMRDRTQEYSLLWPELGTDGHCSYSPDGRLVVTDTYPNRKRLASVYLCTEDDNRSRRIARVFSPFRYDNDCRCDLHPRWSRSGDKACIDSVHEGRRGLYVIDVPLARGERPEWSGERIPKIIHSVWFGKGEQSEIVRRCRDSWSTFLQGYEIRQWDEGSFDLSSACQYVRDAYKEGKFAFVSDYVRLKALYEEGGIYLDTDLEVLRNLDTFLGDRGFFGAESRYTVSTAIIGAEPKAPWIRDLLDEYEHLSFYNGDGSLNVMPNTKRVQAYLSGRYGYEWSLKVQEIADGLFVYPQEYFSPINCFTGESHKTANTFTVHHYDNSWKPTGERVKRRVMQLATRVIGEDNRAALVGLKTRLKGGNPE